MKYKYRISICMMVKNEEKHLQDCLESLRPVTDNLDVELIIVDTGSDDRTIEIAQKHTSKLYFHEWNNNFSEMRNITISYAKGEWIFIVDGDEVLEDAEELIQLFKNEQLNGYNTIQVKIKNFFSLENEKNAGILSQNRFFRNDGDFKFKGSVHNQAKYKFPIYVTKDTYMKHYGYVATDKKLMEKKFKRTATLLKKELEKDPNNIYYNYQLSQSYTAHGDIKESLDQIRKTYDILKNKPLEEKKMYCYIYGVYSRIATRNKKFEEVIDICKEGIRIRPDYIDLYYTLGTTKIMFHQKEEGITYLKKYIELINKLDKLPIISDSAIMIYNINDESKSYAYNIIANYHYEKEEYLKAYTYAKLIIDDTLKIPIIIRTLVGLNRYDELMNYYESMYDDNSKKIIFIENIEEIKRETECDKKDKIEKEFSKYDDIYGICNKIAESSVKERSKLVNTFVNQSDFNNLVIWQLDTLKEIIKDSQVWIRELKKVPNYRIKRYINYLINDDEEVIDKLKEYLLTQNIRQSDFQSIRVYTSIANIILLMETERCKKLKESIDKEYYEIFKIYIDNGIEYIKQQYKLNKMRINYNILDDAEHQFLALMVFVKEALDKNNDIQAIRYIEKAAKVYPYFAPLLNLYKDELFNL